MSSFGSSSSGPRTRTRTALTTVAGYSLLPPPYAACSRGRGPHGEGEVEIFTIIDDHEQVLGTVGKDGIFGEMALIDNKPRMAAARASTSCTIICVTRQMFDEKVNHSDPFIRGLLKILADNNRDMTSKWLSALK